VSGYKRELVPGITAHQRQRSGTCRRKLHCGHLAERNYIFAEALNSVAERHSELSSVGILAISMVIAAVGGAAYLLVAPISAAKIVALEHGAISESVPR
jgi:hypothetical protein